jgi:hypothetical protein
MDLEWFVRNTLGKQISIESVNTDGELGVTVKTLVLDAEIIEADPDYWDGFTLIINDGSIEICFSDWHISPSGELENVLCLSRSGQEFIYINLPEEDNWV